MSKMKEVAQILGVKIDREFRATGVDNEYRITDSRFETISVLSGKWVEAPASILYDLLAGKRDVIKSPFKPKKGEEYWSVTHCGPSYAEWHGGVVDLAYYAVGNCFETKEEAELNSKEVRERLEKLYADGTPLLCV